MCRRFVRSRSSQQEVGKAQFQGNIYIAQREDRVLVETSSCTTTAEAEEMKKRCIAKRGVWPHVLGTNEK